MAQFVACTTCTTTSVVAEHKVLNLRAATRPAFPPAGKWRQAPCIRPSRQRHRTFHPDHHGRSREPCAQSSGISDETGTQPTSASPENELLQSFKELKALMVDADRQKGRPMEATINLNFVVQEDFSISLVAAGQAETSTTHSVCLGFDRSKHEASLRS
jgi:hypothetical protein